MDTESKYTSPVPVTVAQLLASQAPPIAKETGTSYLPFFLEPVALDRSLFQDDGLHPTADAQPIIAEYVGRFLQESMSR